MVGLRKVGKSYIGGEGLLPRASPNLRVVSQRLSTIVCWVFGFLNNYPFRFWGKNTESKNRWFQLF